MLNQDLHIHTIYSKYDSAIVKEQTPEFIAQVNHAKIIGISDHFESFDYNENAFNDYLDHVRSLNMYAGTEVDGYESVEYAIQVDPDYYIYHCFNNQLDYRGVSELLDTGKPVIIAHPLALGTNLSKIPEECYVEINNRYVWRYNWRKAFQPYLHKFKFIFSSDAHQPNWLNQNISQFVAKELGIQESLIF